jgi:hypothetical protein
MSADLSKTLSKYSNKWVALSSDTSHVVSSGNSVKEVVESAKKRGEKDPIVTKVPTEYSNFVL